MIEKILARSPTTENSARKSLRERRADEIRDLAKRSIGEGYEPCWDLYDFADKMAEAEEGYPF